MQKMLSLLLHLDEIQCARVGSNMTRSPGLIATAIPMDGKQKYDTILSFQEHVCPSFSTKAME